MAIVAAVFPSICKKVDMGSGTFTPASDIRKPENIAVINGFLKSRLSTSFMFAMG
jgi:hypothetical protein